MPPAKDIIKALANVFCYCFDSLVLAMAPSAKRVAQVGLVRLDGIGDFVLWLDTAKNYRRVYPDKNITLIANSMWAEWARNFDYWDEVIAIDHRRFLFNLSYRAGIIRKLYRCGFDIAIQPTISRSFLYGDSLIRATQARERIGSEGDESNIFKWSKKISNRWYTRLIPLDSHNRAELERNTEFMQGLTGKPYPIALPYIAPLGQSKVLDGDYFVLFPGASWHGKCWPLEYFTALAVALHQEYGWTLVLCGSKADSWRCNTIASSCAIPHHNLAGQTTLSELAEIIRAARLLVGNDTAAIHIANAVQTPSVCILGGGHHGRFLPYTPELEGIKPRVADHPMPCFNCNWYCSQPHTAGNAVPCVANVSLAQVLSLSHAAVAKKTGAVERSSQ